MASAIAPLAVPVSFATVFIKNLPSDGRAYPVMVHRSPAARIRVITRSRVHRMCAQRQVRARTCARRTAPPGPWDFARWHCGGQGGRNRSRSVCCLPLEADRRKVAAPTVASPGPAAARPIHRNRRLPAPRHRGRPQVRPGPPEVRSLGRQEQSQEHPPGRPAAGRCAPTAAKMR